MLLFRYLRLWYCPICKTNNTEAHAVCTHTRNMRIEIHTKGILCRNVLTNQRIYQIPSSQNKARKTLFINMSLLFYVGKRRGLKTFAGAKVRNFSDMCK